MARGDQLGRQWKIIQSLIASHRGKSAADLANELGCHRRTVYRDLEALQVGGFPVYTTKENGRTRWSLLDKARHHTPLPLSLTELMALYFSRDMLKTLKNTVFHDALESFFQKVKATLPGEYTRYLDRLGQSLRVGFKPHKDYGEFQETIERVNHAVLNQHVIEIDYYAMHRKKHTRRRVAPYKIWFFDETFYLIGHCYLRKDIRLFAIDRIHTLTLTDETFSVPSDLDLDTFMQASFGVFVGDPVKVKIRFTPEVAGYIREKKWHATQKLTPRKDGSLDLEVEVAGTAEIKFWLLSWGAQAEVLEPKSLRREIQAEAKSLYQSYAK